MYSIGLDIGTTKICAILINNKTGEINENNSILNNTSINGENFENLQDADSILEICCNLINPLIAKYTSIDVIGITGQMHGIVYIDENGHAVSPLYTWQDSRGNQKKSGKTYIELIYDITNKHIPVGYGFATHYYNQQNKKISQNACKICTIHDYVALSLSKTKIPLMHSSDCASFGFYDIDKECWDTESLKKLDVNINLLPNITSTNKILGTYKNIPISVAIGDNQASFYGSVNSNDAILVNIGTGSQISILSDNNNSELETRPLNNNEKLLVGCSICGGSSYAILKQMVESIFEACSIAPPQNLYDILNNIGTVGEHTLECDTTFRGTRKDSAKRGSITNISASNFTINNLVFAFLQGISNELFNFYKLSQKKALKLVGSGNAIRRNPLLVKILENTFNLKMTIPLESEEAAYGACLFALVSCGYFKNINEATQIIKYK